MFILLLNLLSNKSCFHSCDVPAQFRWKLGCCLEKKQKQNPSSCCFVPFLFFCGSVNSIENRSFPSHHLHVMAIVRCFLSQLTHPTPSTHTHTPHSHPHLPPILSLLSHHSRSRRWRSATNLTPKLAAFQVTIARSKKIMRLCFHQHAFVNFHSWSTTCA
jgi:hypothetical protein